MLTCGYVGWCVGWALVRLELLRTYLLEIFSSFEYTPEGEEEEEELTAEEEEEEDKPAEQKGKEAQQRLLQAVTAPEEGGAAAEQEEEVVEEEELVNELLAKKEEEDDEDDDFEAVSDMSIDEARTIRGGLVGLAMKEEDEEGVEAVWGRTIASSTGTFRQSG